MNLKALFGVAAWILATTLMGSSSLEAQNILTVQDAIGVPGTTDVEVTITAVNDVAFQGFSLSLNYADVELDLTGLDYTGTISETISPGGVPEYSSFIVDDSDAGLASAVVGVIFDTDPAAFVEVPPSVDANPIAHLLFDVDPSASPSDVDIELVNGEGDPPVNNILSSGGQSIFPDLVDGTFTIPNQYTFRFREVMASPGSAVEAVLEIDNEAQIEGFTVAFTYESSRLTYSPVANFPDDHFDCLDVDTALFPEVVEFAQLTQEVSVEPGRNWIALGVIFDNLPPFNDQSVPPGANQSLARFNFNLSGIAPIGSNTVLDLTDDYPVGAPITNLVVTEVFSGVVPAQEDGMINVTTGTEFRRGDSNSDGVVGIADAIFNLVYLFQPPAPAPACLDAGDVNDDGQINIVDGIFLINYLFLQGCVPPAPLDCGIDANQSDSLDCANYPGC